MSDLQAVHTGREPATVTTSPPEREPIVSVRDLKKSYGETQALGGISFDVYPGQIFGFIGPNGAGKTTTFRILATLLQPTSGSAHVAGYSLETDPEAVRRAIGYMPDQFGVYDGNTVEEYLDFFAAAYRVPRKKRRGIVRDVMALTDLAELRNRLVSALSKGMRQRLCLAKTLVHDPDVLILDEPAAGLDPRARIEFRSLLQELGRMGKTILISSHILTELSDLCNAVAILEQGALVGCGEVDLLQRKQTATSHVRMAFCGPASRAEELLRDYPDVVSVEAADSQLRFEYGGAPEEFYKLVKHLVDNDVPLVAIDYGARDLEGLFMSFTRGKVN